MKRILEVTLAFEVEVDLPDGVGSAEAVRALRTRLDTGSLVLMHGGAECPTKIIFHTEVVSPPFEPNPDEFRCDSCRRDISNDDKCIDEGGSEFCSSCAGLESMAQANL
jgi:hypothetical protein